MPEPGQKVGSKLLIHQIIFGEQNAQRLRGGVGHGAGRRAFRTAGVLPLAGCGRQRIIELTLIDRFCQKLIHAKLLQLFRVHRPAH